MNRVILALLSFSSMALCASDSAVNTQSCCIIADETRIELLGLSYDAFDQTLDGGWRAYAGKECYSLAADLLLNYKEDRKAQLVSWQKRILTWHAGQMYALMSDYVKAKKQFLDAIDPDEPLDTHILWNDYVRASVAFLDDDREKLIYHRDQIANGPKFLGTIVNLDVVNGLLKCLGKPYKVAYSSTGCR